MLIDIALLKILKFIYSVKATKICEISTVDLSYVVPVKSTVEILQNFVAFSKYMIFNGAPSIFSSLRGPSYCSGSYYLYSN